MLIRNFYILIHINFGGIVTLKSHYEFVSMSVCCFAMLVSLRYTIASRNNKKKRVIANFELPLHTHDAVMISNL